MKVEELMNKYYRDLNENDRLICAFILKNKDNCYKLSIPGFSKLKVRLRWESESQGKPVTNLMDTVTESYQSLQNLRIWW